jgi:hypothetical protein
MQPWRGVAYSLIQIMKHDEVQLFEVKLLRECPPGTATQTKGAL